MTKEPTDPDMKRTVNWRNMAVETITDAIHEHMYVGVNATLESSDEKEEKSKNKRPSCQNLPDVFVELERILL